MANLTLNYLRLKFSLLNLLSNSKWLHKRVVERKIYLGATIISMSMLNSGCTSETKKMEEPTPEKKNVDTNKIKVNTLQTNSENKDTINRPIRKINNKHKVLSDSKVAVSGHPAIEVASCYGPVNPNWDNNIKESDVVTTAEVMPQYVGGEEAMMKFFKNNIKITADGKKPGTIFVEFVVTKTGKPTNITVKRGVNPSYDQEVMRAVRRMPNWIPGKNQGKEVNVRMILPVVF